MQCPRCQHESPADAVFCQECGTRLEVACPGCGTHGVSIAQGLTDRSGGCGNPEITGRGLHLSNDRRERFQSCGGLLGCGDDGGRQYMIEPDAVDASWREGGKGYGEYKKTLLAAYHATFGEARARYQALQKDPGGVDAVLRAGAERARALAAPVIGRVRQAVGIER